MGILVGLFTAGRPVPFADAADRGEGGGAFLEARLDPVVQRIVLCDARAVLSMGELRKIESRYTLAALRNGLKNAIASGAMIERSSEMLAHMILGARRKPRFAINQSR